MQFWILGAVTKNRALERLRVPDFEAFGVLINKDVVRPKGHLRLPRCPSLLPADYVQRGPNGVGLETRYSVGLQGFTSQNERRGPNPERPSWEAGRSIQLAAEAWATQFLLYRSMLLLGVDLSESAG